jgi:uncharacterized protein YheU (UPF0270 family)
MVKVPMNALSVEALRGVIDAYVLREGTDYGHRDYALEDKRAAVARQLDHGEAEIWYDPETGSTDIRLRGSG